MSGDWQTTLELGELSCRQEGGVLQDLEKQDKRTDACNGLRWAEQQVQL